MRLPNTVNYQRDITQEKFDSLLRWLDPDRQEAARKYEAIRDSIIKIFSWRGYSSPEDLADETINRVAEKIAYLVPHYEGEPELYFYGVAKRILLEKLKAKPIEISLDYVEFHPVAAVDEGEAEAEERYQIFQECLNMLPSDQRELLLSYYSSDQPKIEHRRQLAKDLNLSPAVLRVKIQRLRSVVHKCIQKRSER